MPDTGNAKDCLELPPTNFSIFTLKNVTWRTYLISFTVQCCFLFRFVSIELVSLIWLLQIWVAIYVYGTIIFNKEINANLYRHSRWEYSECFHCSFEWHLTPHLTLSIETCIRRTPCIKQTLQHSRGCTLNTGFTVLVLQHVKLRPKVTNVFVNRMLQDSTLTFKVTSQVAND